MLNNVSEKQSGNGIVVTEMDVSFLLSSITPFLQVLEYIDPA